MGQWRWGFALTNGGGISKRLADVVVLQVLLSGQDRFAQHPQPAHAPRRPGYGGAYVTRFRDIISVLPPSKSRAAFAAFRRGTA